MKGVILIFFKAQRCHFKGTAQIPSLFFLYIYIFFCISICRTDAVIKIKEKIKIQKLCDENNYFETVNINYFLDRYYSYYEGFFSYFERGKGWEFAKMQKENKHEKTFQK